MIFVVSSIEICRGDIVDYMHRAAMGGADYIMVREKKISEESLLEISLKIAERLRGSGAKIAVNSNVNVALMSGAHVLQLPFADFMQMSKMEIDSLGKKLEIGVSIHSVEEARAAGQRGADYVVAGHVFQTDCKKGLKPRGLDFIRKIKLVTDIPIIAIGGIDSGNIKSVMNAGAGGAAVMSLVMKSESPEGEVAKLKKALETFQA